MIAESLFKSKGQIRQLQITGRQSVVIYTLIKFAGLILTAQVGPLGELRNFQAMGLLNWGNHGTKKFDFLLNLYFWPFRAISILKKAAIPKTNMEYFLDVWYILWIIKTRLIRWSPEDIRAATHRLLSRSSLLSRDCLYVTIEELLKSLEKYSEDQYSIYKAFRDLGKYILISDWYFWVCIS